MSEHLCFKFHHAGQIQAFVDFPFISVICWYKFTFTPRRLPVLYWFIVLLRITSFFWLSVKLNYPEHNQELKHKKKNRHLTNDMGSYKKSCIQITTLSFRFQSWHVKSLQVMAPVSTTRISWTNWKLKTFIAFITESRWQGNRHPKLGRGRHIQRHTAKMFLLGRDAAGASHRQRQLDGHFDELLETQSLLMQKWETPQATVLWGSPTYSWVSAPGIPPASWGKDLKNNPSTLWQGRDKEQGSFWTTPRGFSPTEAGV